MGGSEGAGGNGGENGGNEDRKQLAHVNSFGYLWFATAGMARACFQ
jgi:hypothetical protein